MENDVFTHRRGYSVSKRLVKSTTRACPCSCLDMKIYHRYYLRWVINFKMLAGCSSVQDKLKVHLSGKSNTLNTDLQLMMQKINKFAAGQTRSTLTNTSSNRSHEFYREFYENL